MSDLGYPQKNQSFNPILKMLTYVQVGLILTTIQIDFGWLKYITSCIGILFIFLGLRMAQEGNYDLKIAYRLSWMSIIIHLISLMIIATPFYQNVKSIYAFATAITYLMFYFVYLGLKPFVNNKDLMSQLIKTYILLQASLMLGNICQNQLVYLCLLIAIISFGFLMYVISSIKQEIHEKIPLFINKISSLRISIIYILCIAICIPLSFITTTSLQYQITQSYYDEGEETVKNLKEETYTFDDMKLKIRYSITQREDNDSFEHNIQYTWLQLPKYTYMLDTICYYQYQGYMLTNQITKNYICDHTGRNYESQLTNNITNDYLQSYTTQSLKTYINPFHPDVKGTLHFLVNSQYQDTNLSFRIVFGLKNNFDFPYQEKYNQGIELNMIAKGTELKELNIINVYQ